MDVAVLGEYTATFEPHAATDAALAHSSDAIGADMRWQWVSTSDLGDSLLAGCRGLLVAPGSPYKDMSNTLRVIRFARERGGAVPGHLRRLPLHGHLVRSQHLGLPGRTARGV
jgi:CTP synthase (UTP-ammonia lyase)